jgi:hypothetical protein
MTEDKHDANTGFSVITPGPAEASNVGSGMVTKGYAREMMIWYDRSGFELVASYNDGKDTERERAGPTPTQIARFKADLKIEAATYPELRIFLERHPLLMIDNRSARFGKEAERKETRCPFPHPPETIARQEQSLIRHRKFTI